MSPRGNETCAVRRLSVPAEVLLGVGAEHVQGENSCREKDGVSALLQ